MVDQTYPKLGALLNGDEQRDAIHIALLPVIMGSDRVPGGTPVRIGKDGRAYECLRHASIGIVDPFIVGFVDAGDKVYVLLNPYTITSLRHEWTHPVIDALAKESIEADRVRVATDAVLQFCRDEGINYEMFVECMKSAEPGYVVFGTEVYVSEERIAEIIPHVNLAFGTKHPVNNTTFRCAC